MEQPNQAGAAQGTAPPADDAPEPASPALEAFSAELATRFPGLECRRFVLPAVVRQCREVVIRELLNRDTVHAATQADALMGPLERASVRLTNEAEERESIRLSIVGIGQLGSDGAIVYRHVNSGGVPLVEINEWPKRMWDALSRYFGAVNGLPVEEFVKGLMGGRTVGAFAPPTSATRASAEPGRSGG